MSDLVPEKPKTTYYETDNEGRIQEVCMLTGRIISRAQSVTRLMGGDDTLQVKGEKRVWEYSRAFAEVICQKIAEGFTLQKLCSLDGFPPAGTLARWRAEQEDFDAALKQARKMRAELYHDMIEDDVSQDHDADKDEIASRKLKMDRLKWLAAVNDPETFGNKTKISGDTSAPLQIIVSTGINREKKDEE